MLEVLSLTVTPFAANCRIFYNKDSKKCIVCDPGDDAKLITETIKKHELTPTAIILTHGHHDHCAAAPELSSLLGVEIYGPTKEDSIWLDHVKEQSAMFELPDADNVKVDHFLTDGQKLDFDLGETIKVLHCPGHTPGQVCYYFPLSKLLISGDVLFAGSIGRCDFMYSNQDDLMNAIKTKLFVLDEDVQVLPGHGPNTTIGRELRMNPFFVPDIY